MKTKIFCVLMTGVLSFPAFATVVTKIQNHCIIFANLTLQKNFDSSWKLCNISHVTSKRSRHAAENLAMWIRKTLGNPVFPDNAYNCVFTLKNKTHTHTGQAVFWLFNSKANADKKHAAESLMDVKKVTLQDETKYMAVGDYRLYFYTDPWSEDPSCVY